MSDITRIHLEQIAKAANAPREMICLKADGTEIERRKVSAYARMSMQATSDHKAADKAKAELGEQLDRVTFTGRMAVTLSFDTKGRSFFRFD